MDSLTFWEAYTTLGINYTSASNIVTTVEYIFNSGGLDDDDWDRWFELGKNPLYARELGSIREQIAKKESIQSRQSLFVLSRASDVMTNLDASVLAWVKSIPVSTKKTSNQNEKSMPISNL